MSSKGIQSLQYKTTSLLNPGRNSLQDSMNSGRREDHSSIPQSNVQYLVKTQRKDKTFVLIFLQIKAKKKKLCFLKMIFLLFWLHFWPSWIAWVRYVISYEIMKWSLLYNVQCVLLVWLGLYWPLAKLWRAQVIWPHGHFMPLFPYISIGSVPEQTT